MVSLPVFGDAALAAQSVKHGTVELRSAMAPRAWRTDREHISI